MKRVSVTGVTARTARICHFIVQSKDYGSTALTSLEDAEPPIWRRVEVPAEITLKDLHSVTQARSVGASREQLGDLALRGIKRFTYVYDMGDNWASRRLL